MNINSAQYQTNWLYESILRLFNHLSNNLLFMKKPSKVTVSDARICNISEIAKDNFNILDQFWMFEFCRVGLCVTMAKFCLSHFVGCPFYEFVVSFCHFQIFNFFDLCHYFVCVGFILWFAKIVEIRACALLFCFVAFVRLDGNCVKGHDARVRHRFDQMFFFCCFSRIQICVLYANSSLLTTSFRSLL